MLVKVIALACLIGIAVATQQDLPIGERSTMAIRSLAENFESLSPKQKIESVNKMADVIITEVSLLIGDLGMDPLKLPDVHKNFSYRPIIITYHGELDMIRGWAQDVSEIVRDGDVIMNYTNHVVRVDVPIKFPKLMFQYDYNAKIMSLGPDGTIEGSASNIKIFCSLSIDFENMHVALNKFAITKIGKITAKFSGNGIIDWLVNILSPIVISIFKGLIKYIAEVNFKNVLNTVIALVNDLLANIQPPENDVTQLPDKIVQNYIH